MQWHKPFPFQTKLSSAGLLHYWVLFTSSLFLCVLYPPHTTSYSFIPFFFVSKILVVGRNCSGYADQHTYLNLPCNIPQVDIWLLLFENFMLLSPEVAYSIFRSLTLRKFLQPWAEFTFSSFLLHLVHKVLVLGRFSQENCLWRREPLKQGLASEGWEFKANHVVLTIKSLAGLGFLWAISLAGHILDN